MHVRWEGQALFEAKDFKVALKIFTNTVSAVAFQPGCCRHRRCCYKKNRPLLSNKDSSKDLSGYVSFKDSLDIFVEILTFNAQNNMCII